MADMLWAGRFGKALDQRADDFNTSLPFDSRMYRQDITGSMAHAAMLGAQGIIASGDADTIIEALQGILDDLDSGALTFEAGGEDIHTFVETELTSRIGDVGKRLHTARSRNDQVALDFRLTLRDEMEKIIALVTDALEAMLDQARIHTETIMPGYTHLQRAQPVTFAQHMLAYCMMFSRDITRIRDAVKRMNYSPLGCCALAGTTHPINRRMTAERLGFDGVTQNSLDGVSDRDFCIELLSALSTVMMHLSRISEELVLWSSWEFKFIELDDAYTTGSSIMPQKKNPDMAELIRGKTGRVYGSLMATLTMMKGLPLAYNKDLQEDKEAMFDAIDTVKQCLTVFAPMIRTMRALPDNMRAAAGKGFINATDAADYLTRKGVPFRTAYKAIGELVAECIQTGETLESLPLARYRAYAPEFDQDIYEAISLDTCLNRRTSEGGPAPESTKAQIAYMDEFLAAQKQG